MGGEAATIGYAICAKDPLHQSRFSVTPDTINAITVLGAILCATLALAILILRTSARLERRLERLEVGQDALRERMARIEGLFVASTRREVGNVSSATPGPP